MLKRLILVVVMFVVSCCSMLFAGEKLLDPSLEVKVTYQKDLTIHLLKVGYWRSTLIVSPSGYVTLISAGEKGDGQLVKEYLEKLGISKIDLMIQDSGSGAKYRACGLLELLKAKFPVNKVAYNSNNGKDKFVRVAKSMVSKVFPLKPGKTYKIGDGAKLRCIYVNGKTKTKTHTDLDNLWSSDRDALFILEYEEFCLHIGSWIGAETLGVDGANNIVYFLEDDLAKYDYDVMIANVCGSFINGVWGYTYKTNKPENVITIWNTEYDKYSLRVPDYDYELEEARKHGATLFNNNKFFFDGNYKSIETGIVQDGESIIISVTDKKTYTINGITIWKDEYAPGNNTPPEIKFDVSREGLKLKLDPTGTKCFQGVQKIYYVVSDKGKTISTDSLDPQYYFLDLGDKEYEDDLYIYVKMFAFNKYGMGTYVNKRINVGAVESQPEYRLSVFPNKVILTPIDSFYLDVYFYDKNGDPLSGKHISAGAFIGQTTIDTGYSNEIGHVRLYLKANTYPHTQLYDVSVVARHEKDGEIIAKTTIQLMVSDVN